MEVRREMQPVIRRNKNKANINDAYKAFGPQRNNNSVKLQVGHWVGQRLTTDLAMLVHCALFSIVVLMLCIPVCNPFYEMLTHPSLEAHIVSAPLEHALNAACRWHHC